jgi:transposase
MRGVIGMPGRLFISKEQVEELELAYKSNTNKNVNRRLKALLLYVKRKKQAEIALETKYSVSYLSALVAKYVDNGISAIVDNNYRANRRNISFEEEKELIDGFKNQVKEGKVVDVSTIKKAYEEAIGRSLDNSHGQIYRVLKRHGW